METETLVLKKSTIAATNGKTSTIRTHPLAPEDAAVMNAMLPVVAPHKGEMQGIAAREPFNAIMEQVLPPEGVRYRPDTVGGVSGWWCRPDNPRSGEVILHLHGGWFSWGSAQAFRHLVGHIAVRAGAEAFVPDYKLAPENPFPSAVHDVQACYSGLIALGMRRIALSGDSAGGTLALVLLSLASNTDGIAPVGAAVQSPITDLALKGMSFKTRAVADPYFTQPQAEVLVRSYLGNADALNSMASPLYGSLAGLPPIRIHVGQDEVLLEDSIRYFEKAVAAGVDAELDIWVGMPHGFGNMVGKLTASAQALDAIGAFLAERLTAATEA